MPKLIIGVFFLARQARGPSAAARQANGQSALNCFKNQWKAVQKSHVKLYIAS